MTQTKDIGILVLSKRLSQEHFAEFLKYANEANGLGLLAEYLEFYSGMVEEGSDPGNALAWAMNDVYDLDSAKRL